MNINMIMNVFIAGLIHPFLRLSRHHYEVIIIGTWYEFAHQSSPLSQHTLCESIVY